MFFAVTTNHSEDQGCVRLGNLDFEFEARISDFAFDFHLVPSLSFYWEIRKRICKTVLENGGLISANYACRCTTAVPENSFSNPFSSFSIKRKERNPRGDFLAIKSVLGLPVLSQIRIRIWKSKPRTCTQIKMRASHNTTKLTPLPLAVLVFSRLIGFPLIT